MRFAIVTAALVAGCANEPEEQGPVCGDGDQVTLPYQASQVDGCGWVRGSIHIPDGFADALDPLRNLVGMDGRLTMFRNHELVDLRGLSRLELVGGELAIYNDMGTLASVDGLESLRETGGLRFELDPGLASLRGLSGLQVIHGDLVFRQNAALDRSEIDWLIARVTVEGEIAIIE